MADMGQKLLNWLGWNKWIQEETESSGYSIEWQKEWKEEKRKKKFTQTMLS